MQQSNQTESTGIEGDELFVSAALSPVIRYKKKRKAIEQHHRKSKETEPYIEFSDMPPQVCIGIYRSIFDAGAHSHYDQKMARIIKKIPPETRREA
jgi:hypothetical protein